MKLNIITLIFLLISSVSLQAQIEVGEDVKKDRDEKNNKKKKDPNKVDGSTYVYMLGNWSSSFRTLKENDAPFGDPLGTRADEKRLGIWSFGIGITNYFTKHLGFEGGISLLRNGEQYETQIADSTYKYTSRYTFIGMPLKLKFSYGDKVRLNVSAGVVPQVFSGFRQEIEWKSNLAGSGKETIKTKIGFSSFTMSAVFNVGVQFKFGERVFLMLEPEYRMQLSSTYDKKSSYKHSSTSLGGNVGLVIGL